MSLLPELGVNIDHVATLRQARKTYEPDPVTAATMAELGGADSITIHLREDRRHIQERDVRLLRETITTKMNLELALDDAVLAMACEVKPQQATLVPERREEVSTEGGLDLFAHFDRVAAAAERLAAAGIEVSLFLDPDPKQLEIAAKTAAVAVELHTGQYANASAKDQPAQLRLLEAAGEQIVAAGLRLHAGHGLTVRNVVPIARIPHMHELNIGHSIVARSVFIGLQAAVREMKELMWKAVS